MSTSKSIKITILALLAAFLLCGTTAGADLTDGLIAHWKFDEAEGTFTFDSAGSNDGTINGPQWTTGQIHYALDFDGTDDRVEIPHSDALNLTSEISIAMWIKPDTLPNANKDLFHKAVYYSPESTRANYNIRTTEGGKVQFAFRNSGDTFFSHYQTIDTALSIDNWYHVCIVHQFGNGSDTKIYVNGVPQAASWLAGTGDEMPMTGSYPLIIGAIRIGYSGFLNFFDGKIDDICLYNRVLSDEDVQALQSYRWSLEYAADELERAITKKAAALAELDAAIEKESSAYATLEEILQSSNSRGLRKNNINRAKRLIDSTIRHQEQAENILNKSISTLKNSLVFLGMQTTPSPEPNLVSHWSFDKGTGIIAYDSTGSNDGTIIGDTAWVTGQIGGALDFDGDGDYVEIANDDSLNIANKITICAWVKPTAYHSDLNTIVQKWGDLSNRRQYELTIYNNKVRWYISTNGSNSPNLTGQEDIPLNQWSHIVCTYDGSIMKIYVNGNFDGYKGQNGNIFASNINARIGGYGQDVEWSANRHFNGSIDDVRIYNRALSAVEVALLYCNLLE